MPKKRTTIAIEEEHYEEIQNQIENENMNQSDWIRDAIEQKITRKHHDFEDLQNRIENIEEKFEERLTAVESALIRSTGRRRRGSTAGDYYEDPDQ